MSVRPRIAFTATIDVPLPPERAFTLFTARGEQNWVAGWVPHFPAETDDDATPGTVFWTEVDGRTTTWIVADAAPPNRIRYARLATPAVAALVTVELAASDVGSRVQVAYDATSLAPGADDEVRAMAANGAAHVSAWEGLIRRYLDGAERPAPA